MTATNDTTAKHTPGPWRYERIGSGAYSYYDNAKGMATIILSASGDPARESVGVLYYASNWEEAEANAALIAAAPTMLDALQAAVACGNPHRVSLYDHEAVEGWRWDHPDGREWIEVTGDWSETPLHPLIEAAIDLATPDPEVPPTGI